LLGRVGKGAEHDRKFDTHRGAVPTRAHGAPTNEAHCGAGLASARLCAPYKGYDELGSPTLS